MIDPSPFNLTISHCNQSLRRALQIYLLSSSACSYACKGMIKFSTTILVRKLFSQIHFCISSPNLALRLHWILPFTLPAYPLSKRKSSNWLLRWLLRCVPWMISSSLDGLMTSRKSLAQYIPTCSTVNHSLFKMDLCSMVKPSTSHHQKGEGPWYYAPVKQRHYQCTVACLWLCLLAWYQQGHLGCCLVMFNMHEISGQECSCTTHANTYSITSLADMCIGHFHIG